ncbi:MAG: tRNA (N(6)-L-threonylcarbamoyladenosine(37)-C(2))-methylthiotransferase MtaB [Candidatus Marinimicrobia bacterium]|jgi:threonylcarbamoyladenosine tRNA methylthiotransferase MtaB|nr:tRNA (N(6)-L-threonylcarbamoyladenosine(37)-C(2))-methylthiotransferase MtaB [Candidatus Neomarinimicrobiota bacterium]
MAFVSSKGLEKTVAFHTLGCKLNFAESASIGTNVESHGFRRVDFSQQADVYVVNTCSVTDSADRKCKKVVRQVLRKSPKAFVAVIGCYAQLRPKEISTIPGVDLVLGAGEKFNLPAYLSDISKRESGEIHSCEIETVDHFFPSYSTSERTRAFLKVQDGCDYTCSYCTIPMARGRSRSYGVEQTVAVARQLLDKEVREIVLTGVNIGDFGAGTEETFIDLLTTLDRIGAERIRISSIEPNLLTDDIIDFLSGSNSFVPHFHMPLQSGSDKILKQMRRRYSSELYQSRVKKVKRVMPYSCIGVDVIVGFPGETDDDFEETVRQLNDADISYLHVFSYSERPETEAVKMKQKIAFDVRAERSKQLQILSINKRRAFYESCLGQVRTVLFETWDNGILEGFTDNYIRVEVEGKRSLSGKTQRVSLRSIIDGVMQGALAD